MKNNTLDEVSAAIQQQVCNPQMQSMDQQDVDAENGSRIHLCPSLTDSMKFPCT